jgi:hypothetical protein
MEILIKFLLNAGIVLFLGLFVNSLNNPKQEEER